jgi:hypothetical protein
MADRSTTPAVVERSQGSVPGAGAAENGRAGAGSRFDLNGLSIRVRGDWHEVRRSIELDFAWFAAPDGAGPADVEIEIERGAPNLDSFGDVPAAFVTPRNVVYQVGDRTIVEYFGRAITVLDRDRSRVLIQGDDEGLVHEAAYQFMLSRVGTHIDSMGWTRLHGLGLTGGSGATVVMMPSGGGKTTLALRALQEPADSGVRLLSEDTPLLDRHGVLHPFVLRIGVNETNAARLGVDSPRRLERMEFKPKVAIEVETFADRIESRPQPLRNLVIGRRSLGDESRLERIPRRAAIGPMLREAVIGVGVYQGMEFVLQHGMRDTAGKAGTALSRAACCGAGLRGACVWSLTVGRDEERNWAAVRTLLD